MVVAVLVALLVCLANGAVLAALAAPYAARAEASGMAVLAGVLIVTLVVPWLIGTRVVTGARRRGLQPIAPTVLATVFVVWNAGLLGAAAMFGPRPLSQALATDGAWLPAQLLGDSSSPVRAARSWLERLDRRAPPAPASTPAPAPVPDPPPAERGLPALLEAIDRARTAEARTEAVNAIARLGPAAAEAMPVLRRLLMKDRSLEVQIAAANALAATVGRRAVPIFRDKGKQYYSVELHDVAEVAVIRTVNQALISMGESPCEVHRP